MQPALRISSPGGVPPGFVDPTVERGGAPARCWAPFRPLPDHLCDVVLDLLGVGPQACFVDFGSGDGRVVEAAARRGADAVGIEFDRRLVDLSRSRLRAAGLARAARILHAPLESVPPDGCTHAYLWLLPWAYRRLVPRLFSGDPVERVCFVGVDVPPWGELQARFVSPRPDWPSALICRSAGSVRQRISEGDSL